MSNSRPDHLTHSYSAHASSAQARSSSPSANNSPIEPSSRSPFGHIGGIGSGGIMAGNSRSGAGSPSHDMGTSSRLFSKRAREIQAQEGIPGIPLNPWGGPPTSGNSTPLRENIPESPTDGFPDFGTLPTPESISQPRRARAGTVPSRFSPGGPGPGLLGASSLAANSARVTPSQSPFGQSPSPSFDHPDNTSSGSTLLSRLRAGSMPQRSPFAPLPGTSSPFGQSIFSSWNPSGIGRERGSTLASIASVGSNGLSSPSQSQFSKEGGVESDVHMRTLDYLGLAETPQQARAQLATPYMPNVDFTKQSSRFRSYSVNNKDKYADEEDDYDDGIPIDSQYVAALQDQLAATNAAIRNHNLAVQAFANQASANRPRARTAGVLENPGNRLMRNYLAGNPISASDVHLRDEKDYEDLPQAVAGMGLGRSNSRNAGLLGAEEQGLEGPTSALWLGGIPTSTTTSTLLEMFKSHGPILSARVLTHKNCGFVNFERVESAISAKSNMNGKEIFPGAGPIRINFAKPPSASNTPGHDGAFPSPSPDPFSRGNDSNQGAPTTLSGDSASTSALGNVPPTVPPLSEMTADIMDIVVQYGASEDQKAQIFGNLRSAIEYDDYRPEIPPVGEPTQTRSHDAPKLRDIRKRIDNQLMSQSEIEITAKEMLPEIAELSSDYLGNTVVQKLFEHCSDPVRDLMLEKIAPHLAEIGIHKNGTWAAQKIIDVCKTHEQMTTIVQHIRPYTVPLFLDQYGNYVLQGCLKYGAPYNDFIFETMISRIWDVGQGRYGARAVRACLESHHACKEQQLLLGAAITLHAVQLATNANGALLLTWLLDTASFPQRRTVLAPRLVPYMVYLCTHKVAYLTVMKVVNQKNETEARDIGVKALFFTPNDQVLEAILRDNSSGATLIFKVLTTPHWVDPVVREQVQEATKNVLLKIKAQPNQGYKRVMDEVGLSTRTAGSNRDSSSHSETRQRQTPKTHHGNGQASQSGPSGKSFHNAMNPSVSSTGFDAAYATQRPDSTDPSMQSFPAFNQGMMYTTPGGPMPPPMTMQQLQYQQSMMNRANPAMAYGLPPMQPGFGGFSSPGPADQFRQGAMANGSPIQPPTSQIPQMPSGQPFAPPGFSMGGYGYNNMGGVQNMGYMQQEQVNGNGRRGRR